MNVNRKIMAENVGFCVVFLVLNCQVFGRDVDIKLLNVFG